MLQGAGEAGITWVMEICYAILKEGTVRGGLESGNAVGLLVCIKGKVMLLSVVDRGFKLLDQVLKVMGKVIKSE